MVVKGRKPHRRACLCCAEGGALPFSLRRANGDTLLEDTWTLDDDDEAPPATAAATAEVRQESAPAPRGADSTPQPPATRTALAALWINQALPSGIYSRAALTVGGVLCVALAASRARRALSR